MSESGNGEQPTPGPVFNPQTGFPVGEPGAPPPYPQPPYQQPAYPQAPYPQPPSGENPYGQNPYGAAPQYGYPTYVAPRHPRAVLSLVLGLVSTVGAFLCGITVLAAPFAWVISAKARREIRESQGQLTGGGMATAGLVLGIIGTVLLVLVLALIVAAIIWAAQDPTGFNDFWDDGTTV